MTILALYVLAAAGEICGCFAFWVWLRLGRSVFWVLPGLLSLAGFAFLLTRVNVAFAGRSFAAYGGVYIAASVLWLWLAEGQRPDVWDIAGAAISLLGATIILVSHRAA